MAKIEWNDSYSVGIPKLDAQHKALIRVINQLEDVKRHGGVIADVIAELNRYVKEHFRDEEEMLQGVDYQELQAHKKEHYAFEEWLESVELAYNSGYASSAYDVADSVQKFLKDWLVNHILNSDMAYKTQLSRSQPSDNG